MKKTLMLVVMLAGCGGVEPAPADPPDDEWVCESCFTHVVDPNVRPIEEARTCVPCGWIPRTFCWDVPGACHPSISDGIERPEDQASWCVVIEDGWYGRRAGEMFPGCGKHWDCLKSRIENPPCCGEDIAFKPAAKSAWNCDGSIP